MRLLRPTLVGTLSFSFVAWPVRVLDDVLHTHVVVAGSLSWFGCGGFDSEEGGSSSSLMFFWMNGGCMDYHAFMCNDDGSVEYILCSARASVDQFASPPMMAPP